MYKYVDLLNVYEYAHRTMSRMYPAIYVISLVSKKDLLHKFESSSATWLGILYIAGMVAPAAADAAADGWEQPLYLPGMCTQHGLELFLVTPCVVPVQNHAFRWPQCQSLPTSPRFF